LNLSLGVVLVVVVFVVVVIVVVLLLFFSVGLGGIIVDVFRVQANVCV